MLSNDTQIPCILWFWAIFIKSMPKNAAFLLFGTTRVKRIIWNQHYFGQCSYCPNIDKNNYPEETELDTNPSLTLARNLTLSTGERSFGHSRPVVVTTPRLLILRIWIHQKIWGGSLNLDQKSQITIAWNWGLKHKYNWNRSCWK